MLALAMLGPSAAEAASNPGAIWTSTSTGTQVNGNNYDKKEDVYLNGGPQNCGGGGGLPEGDYYFQVTDPSGATLLSSDALKFRQVHVNASGVISGVSGSGNHATGTGSCNGALSVQLKPYADTPNNGNEYSVDLASIADVADCPGYNIDSTTLNFLSCTNGKNDNFKVGASVSPPPSATVTPSQTVTPSETVTPTGTVTPTETVTPTGTVTPTETVAPTGTPVPGETVTPTGTGGGVEGQTGAPGVTPPNTATLGDSAPTSSNLRFILLVMAALLASILVLTPSKKATRR